MVIFIVSIVFSSLEQKTNLKNKAFCKLVMPLEKDKISEFKQYMKSDKMPYIIYTDNELIIRKIYGRANNPEKYLIMKIGEHIPCGYLMSKSWGSDHKKDKYNLYRGEDCMKKFCESLREHAESITDFEKKKMLPLTRKELKSY